MKKFVVAENRKDFVAFCKDMEFRKGEVYYLRHERNLGEGLEKCEVWLTHRYKIHERWPFIQEALEGIPKVRFLGPGANMRWM